MWDYKKGEERPLRRHCTRFMSGISGKVEKEDLKEGSVFTQSDKTLRKWGPYIIFRWCLII